MHHSLDVQIFDDDRAVSLSDSRRESMDGVTSSACYLGVQLGDLGHRFAVSNGTWRSSAALAIEIAEFGEATFEDPGIINCCDDTLARRDCCHSPHTEINAHHRRGGDRTWLLGAQHRHLYRSDNSRASAIHRN
jgi:hypothetical protein